MMNTLFIKRGPGFKLLLCLIVIGIQCIPLCIPVGWAGTGPESTPADSLSGWWEAAKEGFDYSLRVFSYGTYQDIADSTLNPNNDFMQIPRYRFDTEIRPDLSFSRGPLLLSAKPRAIFIWQRWEEGPRAGEHDWDDDWYLNEGLVRVGLSENLFVSYGRENLQWGPSVLISPSNPFFRDNGRRNPIQEVAGMDFARAVWLPNWSWTLSLIANTDNGRQQDRLGSFEKIYAAKLDYTGQSAYASLIVSHRENDRNRLGGFAGWTATDALLLYAEGIVSKGTNALYPQAETNPLGASLVAVKDDSGALEGTLVVGASYTLALGPTLTLEYAYNSAGYTSSEAEAYYRLRRNAAQALYLPGFLSGLAQLTLGQSYDTGLRLLRQNYLMLQYVHTDIYDVLNLTGLWVQNLDDGSAQFISIVEYDISDHIELFSTGNVYVGGDETEFGSIFDVQWILGVKYTF